jgi:iron complex transport system ATP-binding protein
MSQEGSTSIVLDHVTVKRGGVSVLDDVSLDAARGQLTALVGPNGAGKSTLIKAILGLLKTESGAVWVDGAPVQMLSPKARARTMAYLPQERSLAWSMTGGDLAALGRFAWGGAAYDRLSRADRVQVDLALEHASASHLKDRLVHDLSGGNRRGSIWRARWRPMRRSCWLTSPLRRLIPAISWKPCRSCAVRPIRARR